VTEARRLRGLLIPAILTLVVVAILVSLGNWQLRRLTWKEGLIAAATERPREAARDLPPVSDWPALDPASEDGYRPFRMTGRFLNDREVRVFTSLPDPRGPYGGPGYWIVTPFELATGGAVLVNRGFAPAEKSLPSERGETLPEGEISVTGLMRPDEGRSTFTPTDEPGDDIFFARNVAAIAAAKDIPAPVAPFTIDLVAAETPPGGLPQAGETRMAFTNNHLQYAITWYGLGAAALAVFLALAWRTFRERDQKRA
jgi:surfeit locus 1 family protein